MIASPRMIREARTPTKLSVGLVPREQFAMSENRRMIVEGGEANW